MKAEYLTFHHLGRLFGKTYVEGYACLHGSRLNKDHS